MPFQPNTTIYFLRTGIDAHNKVVCRNQAELQAALMREGNMQGVMENCSFQRADGSYRIAADHSVVPYYALMQCDTVMYKNNMQTAAFWIVGNITAIEWKNEGCSYVYFAVDHFMTYQSLVQWDLTYAFIEREHVKYDWSGDGGNPLFSNMGPAEDFGVVPDTPFYSWTKNFETDWVIITSPYDSSGNAVFDGKLRGNLYTSLQTDILTPEEANERFTAIAEKKTASINNIVGVYGCPKDWGGIIRNGGMAPQIPGQSDFHVSIPAVNIAAKEIPAPPVYNNAKCWSSPFVTIRLMSSEGSTIDFTPQWFGNARDTYNVRWRIGGSGGMFGGAQCTFENNNGAFNWDVWNDFIVAISRLPACPWTGDGFTDWDSVNGTATKFNALNTLWNAIGNTFNTYGRLAEKDDGPSGAMSLVTSTVNGAANSVEAGLNLQATINQQKASGATVNGGGTFNNLLDIAAGSWGFKVVYYTVQQYIMSSIDSYFDRFGYRVNRMKKLELQNRPYWTFLKTSECHVIGNPGIPFLSERAINNMFNVGVTMWSHDKYVDGQKIGDFSKASENRGIM